MLPGPAGAAQAGRVEARLRQGGFTVGDPLWEVLTQAGGNVAELRRGMLRAQDEGVLERWGAEFVPSLATLHRAIKDELRAGRVLQVARAASGRVEPSRYDRGTGRTRLRGWRERPAGGGRPGCRDVRYGR